MNAYVDQLLQLQPPGMALTTDPESAWVKLLEGVATEFARIDARSEDRVFYPGHGHAIEDPAGMIAHQRSHRRAREAQIVEALVSLGEATPMELTRAIYTDVDPRLHGAASRNVFATLLGLVAEGRAEAEGGIAPGARFRLLR